MSPNSVSKQCGQQCSFGHKYENIAMHFLKKPISLKVHNRQSSPLGLRLCGAPASPQHLSLPQPRTSLLLVYVNSCQMCLSEEDSQSTGTVAIRMFPLRIRTEYPIQLEARCSRNWGGWASTLKGGGEERVKFPSSSPGQVEAKVWHCICFISIPERDRERKDCRNLSALGRNGPEKWGTADFIQNPGAKIAESGPSPSGRPSKKVCVFLSKAGAEAKKPKKTLPKTLTNFPEVFQIHAQIHSGISLIKQ